MKLRYNYEDAVSIKYLKSQYKTGKCWIFSCQLIKHVSQENECFQMGFNLCVSKRTPQCSEEKHENSNDFKVK